MGWWHKTLVSYEDWQGEEGEEEGGGWDVEGQHSLGRHLGGNLWGAGKHVGRPHRQRSHRQAPTLTLLTRAKNSRQGFPFSPALSKACATKNLKICLVHFSPARSPCFTLLGAEKGRGSLEAKRVGLGPLP